MKVMDKESGDEAYEPSPCPALPTPQPSLSVTLHDLLPSQQMQIAKISVSSPSLSLGSPLPSRLDTCA